MGLNRPPFGYLELLTVLDSLREGIQVIDPGWRYLYLNAAALAHGRQAREDLIGRTMQESYPGIEETELFQFLRQGMEQRVAGSMQNEFTYPGGRRGIFELRVQPCAAGIAILSIDVTQERKLEAQLRHAQKMEAIGQLAGSVAHDFNNLLSVILSYSEMLLQDLKQVDPARPDVEAIRNAGAKAADLTRQLLAFSRQQILAPRVLNLNELLVEIERMLHRLLGANIELVTRYDRALQSVRVDPSQIDQVVMNLVINARDAMPEGGKVTIETKNVVLDESYRTEHFGVAPGPHVMLAVSDTGCGMDQEVQARIFEPFFTTKEPGRGTGLGLATVFGIVQQSGGNIWVYSETGRGTTFKIYLPVAVAQDQEAIEYVQPATLTGTETILLVEDQDEVRRVALQILRRAGYHVLEARNAGEALMTCEKYPRAIHLLLTDVVMPQVSGPELAERLLGIRPDLKVLYMSGYTERAVFQHGILDSGASYLQKPLVPDGLNRRVREVIDTPARLTTKPPRSR